MPARPLPLNDVASSAPAAPQEDPSHITPTQGFNIKSVTKDGFKLNVRAA